MKLNRRALGVVLAIAAAVGTISVAGTAAAQSTEFCTPPTAIRIEDRTLDVWYGTLTIKDSSGTTVKTIDLVRFDKELSADVRDAIAAEAPDPRLAPLLPSQPVNGESGFEWAIGPEDGDPGTEQALRDAYAAAATAEKAGSPVFSSVATTGPAAYIVGTFDTGETAPVTVGDSDSPVLCGTDGVWFTIANDFSAEVTFHELNATATLAPTPPPPPARASATSSPTT